MVSDITSAATGIITNVVSLLTPTNIVGDSGSTPSGYTYLLALVGFAAVFAVSRRVLKKIR